MPAIVTVSPTVNPCGFLANDESSNLPVSLVVTVIVEPLIVKFEIGILSSPPIARVI